MIWLHCIICVCWLYAGCLVLYSLFSAWGCVALGVLVLRMSLVVCGICVCWSGFDLLVFC